MRRSPSNPFDCDIGSLASLLLKAAACSDADGVFVFIGSGSIHTIPFIVRQPGKSSGQGNRIWDSPVGGPPVSHPLNVLSSNKLGFNFCRPKIGDFAVSFKIDPLK